MENSNMINSTIYDEMDDFCSEIFDGEGLLKYISAKKDFFINPKETLENLFDGIKSKELMGNDEILEKADKITQRYILENIPKKLSYIDEQILVMYYGLEDRVYTEKEIAKVLNIGHHNINILKEKALNKLSINMLKNEFTRNSEESEYLIN